MSIENDEYIRVSTILAQWDRFGMIDADVLEAKKKIGQNVHSAINADAGGIYLPLSDKESGYFKSFSEWKERTGAEIVHSELLLKCEYLKIRGTIDALVKIPGTNQLILVDFKTSASEDSKFWRLQGMFYHYLAEKNGYPVVDSFIFLKLDKDGGRPKACDYKCSIGLMNVCKAALLCYKYTNGLL